MIVEVILGVWFLSAMFFGLLGCFVASEKGRGCGEGFWLGAFLGIFGVFLVALLPTKIAAVPEASPQQQQPSLFLVSQLAQEDEKRRQDAANKLRAQQYARAERLWQERQNRSQERREWFSREIVRFGWFKRLPDLPQAILLGLGASLPVAAILAVVFGTLLG